MAWAAEAGALASYLEEHAVSLVCLSGDARGTRFKLEGEQSMLGSDSCAAVSLDFPGVAPQHAVIEFWGGAFVLREVDPARPVLLTGTRCHCRELHDGDRLEIGELTLEFHCERL